MSHLRRAVLCASALVVIVVAGPALPRRTESKDSKMVEENNIIARRLPMSYVFPYSLWPIPRIPVKDRIEESEDGVRYRINVGFGHIYMNKR